MCHNVKVLLSSKEFSWHSAMQVMSELGTTGEMGIATFCLCHFMIKLQKPGLKIVINYWI